MSSAKYPVYLLFLLAAAMGSCDDIIEPDISGQTVQLLTPADSATSSSAVQSFRWAAVAGARAYRIQVGSPSLASPGSFLLDSVLGKSTFAVALRPGRYQWRVQAVNDSYQSGFTTRTIRIDSTGSLAGQQLLLQQPVNGSVTGTPLIHFAWTPLPMAQRYILHLSPHPRQAGVASWDTILTSGAGLPLRLARDSRTYQWKVTALNSFSVQESAQFSVEVDVTPPALPSFNSPADGTFFLSLPITLAWSRTGTDIARDSVYLYRADKRTLVTAYPQAATAMTLTLSSGPGQLGPGTYYWALRSVDRAGNRSSLTGLRSFILQ